MLFDFECSVVCFLVHLPNASIAGCDSCIGTAFIEEDGLSDALSNGTLSVSALDAALTRTLSVRFRLGMFDPPNSTIYTTYGPERINTAAAQVIYRMQLLNGELLLSNVKLTCRLQL